MKVKESFWSSQNLYKFNSIIMLKTVTTTTGLFNYFNPITYLNLYLSVYINTRNITKDRKIVTFPSKEFVKSLLFPIH